MDATVIVIGVITFLCCFYWYRRPKRFPPGPRGFPFLGATPFLGSNPSKVMKKWSETYGSVMSIRMGAEDQVILNGYDVIMQALVKQSEAFSGRPHIPYLFQLSGDNGLVFTDYGEKWKSQRKFGLTTLRGFGLGKKSMEGRIIEEVGYLNDAISSKDGKAFIIADVIRYAVCNIISNLVFGKRFEYDDLQFQDIVRRLNEGFSTPVGNLLILIPWLKYIPPFSSANKQIVDDMKLMLDFFTTLINEHEDTFQDGELRDFIDAFIKEMKKAEDSYFVKRQLVQYVDDLFEAGTETTSSTLTWGLLCCLYYPETQTKLREEIMKVLGPDGTISMSKKNEMPYTNAFIQELYRFRTLAPLSLPHKTNKDTNIGGYLIPEGTTVIANIWSVHNDSKVWNEPSKFKPERFLDDEGNCLPSNHVIPFSVGPRHCLGEQLARMEVFMFLVGMIQKFEFLPDPEADQLPDIEGYFNGISFTSRPCKIAAKLAV